MFEAYSNTTTVYAQNNAINFQNVRFEDCRVRFNNGTTFTLKTPGKYLVLFNGVGRSSTAESPFTIQLYKDEVPVAGATSTITSTAANDPQTLSINSTIGVNCSCMAVDNTTNLKFVATSVEVGALVSATVTIIKIK